MCWSAATAASAAAASGSTKLLRSGIDGVARRLACARWPSSLSRPCRAVTRAQMSCAEVSRLGGLARLGAAQRCARVVWRRIWPAARLREQPDARIARARVFAPLASVYTPLANSARGTLHAAIQAPCAVRRVLSAASFISPCIAAKASRARRTRDPKKAPRLQRL